MRNGIAAADGPTHEFSKKHSTIASAAGGRRVYTTLERLLRTRHISPEQCEAGGRFAYDVLNGPAMSMRSCLAVRVGRSTGDGTPSEARLGALIRYREAAAALDEASIDTPVATAHDLLIAIIVLEASFNEVARRADVRDDVVRSWVASGLGVLASHYARSDCARGRSSTRFTNEAALERFDMSAVAA